MATLPTIPNNPTVGSQYGGELNLTTMKLGDGFEQRVQNGLNNQFQDLAYQYEMMSQTEFNTLFNFILANKGGETIDAPNLVIDPTGSTMGKFYIKGFNVNHNSAPHLFDVQLILREVAQ